MDFLILDIPFIKLVELTAVLFGLAYVLLAIKIHHWCWYMTICSSILFLLLFWNVELYLMSLLQFFYLGIAVYGLVNWHPKQNKLEKKIKIMKPKSHLYIIGLIVLSSIIIGWFLSRYTDDAAPYLDTVTSVGGVVASYMVARKILENWLYWIAIDATSIFVYIDRELYLTVLLFGIYLILAAFGYHQWKLSYQQQ